MNCKQNGMTLENYHAKLKKIWDELVEYEQLPASTDTELIKELTERQEQVKLIQFLVGLDGPIFGIVRSNVLSKDPLPIINQEYSKLIQDDKVKKVNQIKGEGNMMKV